MQKSEIESTSYRRVILAPEGFFDRRYLSIIRNNDVSIIEVRVLSDGPVIHSVHHSPTLE